MKRLILPLLFIAVTTSSCFKSKVKVGEGPKTKTEITAKNHYLVYGLFAIKTADVKQMAAGSKDYDVEFMMSPLDAVFATFTGGIYVPMTVVVKK